MFQVGINLGDAVALTGTSAPEQTVRRTPDAGRYVLADVQAKGPAMFDTSTTGSTRRHPPASTKYSASPPSDGVFQQIGGAANAFGRFCHLGGDLTGLSDALRIKDGTQVCDQRTQVTGRERPALSRLSAA